MNSAYGPVPTPPSPEETFRSMLEHARSLQNGAADEVDALSRFYAENTDVRHPLDPLGDHPLQTREALRAHFAAAAAAPSGLGGVQIDDIRIHETSDPEVIVCEFTYRGAAGWAAPNIVVARIRNGEIVESRDYIDHLGLARASGALGALTAALATQA